MVAAWLSLFLWSMDLLNVSHCLHLFLAVFHCLFDPMEWLQVSEGLLWFWLFLTVSPSAKELLIVSHSFYLLLAVSHILFGPIVLLHVSWYLPW